MPEPGFAVPRLRQTGLVGNKDDAILPVGIHDHTHPDRASRREKPFGVAGSRNLMLLGLLSPEIRVAVIEEKGYKA